MKSPFLVLFALLVTTSVFAQRMPAYELFNAKGKKVSYNKMIRVLKKADVVLFGEHHNNPIVHWLQFETLRTLDRHRELTLGAEMFEADNQDALSAYIRGEIDHIGLDSLARLWKNYKTDYKPLVDYARDRSIRFIATNIPRRYASAVYRGGFEALDRLSSKEKAWIAPLPIAYDPELEGYANMKNMMGGHGGENLPKAQAIKDATMAYFLLKNREANKLFIHFNGSYHSDNYEGINWYIKRENPHLTIVTIGIAEQSAIKKLESKHRGTADVIIAIPDSMTKTY